jgi:pimeloyl-ACP methyl ester carboxylesterase
VALDPPGHGLSDRWPGFRRADVPDVFAAVLDHLGAKRAVLGGHSYGAAAALAGAAGLGRRVEALLLYDGGDLSDRRTPAERHEDNARFLATTIFPSWEAFLDSLRADARVWDEDEEVAARAAMVERDGAVRFRVDVATADDATAVIAASAPEHLPVLDLPALLLRAGAPPELEAERQAGIAALRAKLPRLTVRVAVDARPDLLSDARDVVLLETAAFLARLPAPAVRPRRGS